MYLIIVFCLVVVFLSSVEKHVNYLVANILQSFVFALVHQNLKLFIFYFVFGFIAGYYSHRTKSLLTGVTLHITNNLIAFIAIIVMQSKLWKKKIIFFTNWEEIFFLFFIPIFVWDAMKVW